jgi:hypothetical protein
VLSQSIELINLRRRIRIIVVWHNTWAVNSIGHLWGYRNYETPDDSRNSLLVGIVITLTRIRPSTDICRENSISPGKRSGCSCGSA